MFVYMRGMKSFGGLLMYGIPDFRLPRDVVKNTIQKVLDLGVETNLGMELGKDITLNELRKKYDSVLLCFGANISSKMYIEGENLEGVYGGNELLEYREFPDFSGKTVAVIGGGNTAMDVSRTINKMGAKKVIVIYRRARKQMPAEDVEVEDAINEGVEFLFQNNITKILGKEKVEAVECIKTELIKVDGDRERPVNIDGSNYIMNVDFVIMALGAAPNKETLESLDLELNEWGRIKIDENMQTSIEGVFAAGDLAGAKSTVAWAAKSGRDAAEKLHQLLHRI